MSSSRIAGRGDDEDDDYRGRGHEGSTASQDAEDFDFEGLNFMGGFLNDDLDDDSKDDASDYNLKDRRLDADSREYDEIETTRRRPGWAASSIAKTAGSDSPSYRDGNPRNQQQQQGKEQPDWTDSDSSGLYGSHISTNNKEAMYEAYNQLHVLAQVRRGEEMRWNSISFAEKRVNFTLMATMMNGLVGILHFFVFDYDCATLAGYVASKRQAFTCSHLPRYLLSRALCFSFSLLS
jgi:hypothetical protein